MKKLLVVILTISMISGLLAGCGGSSAPSESKVSGAGTADSDEASQKNGSDTQTQGENNSGGTYNVIMQWPTLGEAPAGLPSVEAAINEITEPAIGVTLTLEPVNAFNLANETALAISSGDKLDLCLSLFTGVGNLVNTGSIIALDDLCDTYGADIKTACDERLNGGYYGGTLYGVPNAYMNGEQTGYVCRADILDKYGITIDENKVYTMDELGEIFEKVKAGEGDSFYCIGGTNSSANLFANFYAVDVLGATMASGGLMLGDEFTSTDIVNVFETDEYKTYAQTMYDWAKKGYFSADASTNTEDGATQVKGGNYLGWFAGFVGVANPDEYYSQTGMEMKVIKTIGGHSMSNMFQSILWSIPTTCENPEKTMEFLNYIYKDNRVGTLLQYGIENQDYVIVEQNESGTVIDFPEGLSAETIPYYCMFGVFGNRLEQPIRYPMSVDWNKNAKAFSDSITHFSPALGYCFVIDNVSSEYSAVSSVMTQYVAIISCGAIDPATELPEFQKALKDAGIDKVIDENRAQFAQWLAANK